MSSKRKIYYDPATMTLDMSALPQPKYNQIKHHVQDLFPYKHGKIQQDGEKQDDRENNA